MNLSKIVLSSRFWQVILVPKSKLLTTFITPFGRFCFNHLPFGITSAPEYFQREMSKILDGIKRVICQTDDILVHSKDQIEHDERLKLILKRLECAKVTLNKAKCEFSISSVKFLGHLIEASGILSVVILLPHLLINYELMSHF